MLESRQTDEYSRWFAKLKTSGRGRIMARIRRLSLGNPGDVAPVGEGVSELRVDYGPGYRVYYKQEAEIIVILPVGGDKRTQQRDIEKAKELARNL